MPQPRKIQRAALTLAMGLAAAGGAIWLQKTLWPNRARNHAPAVPATPAEMNQQLFPASLSFDWNAPPLPRNTRVQSRLQRGSAQEGTLRLQLLCTSPQSADDVLEFYQAELAKSGWKKYNLPAGASNGTRGELYRAGELSLSVFVFPNKGVLPPLQPGCDFRLSVLTMSSSDISKNHAGSANEH